MEVALCMDESLKTRVSTTESQITLQGTTRRQIMNGLEFKSPTASVGKVNLKIKTEFKKAKDCICLADLICSLSFTPVNSIKKSKHSNIKLMIQEVVLRRENRKKDPYSS